MKTKEQAAKEYASKYANLSYSVEANPIAWSDLAEPFAIGFKQGVEFAEQWISVEDELPETSLGTSVVMICKNDELNYEFSAYYNSDELIWKSYPSGRKIDVTHWRPIFIK